MLSVILFVVRAGTSPFKQNYQDTLPNYLVLDSMD